MDFLLWLVQLEMRYFIIVLLEIALIVENVLYFMGYTLNFTKIKMNMTMYNTSDFKDISDIPLAPPEFIRDLVG